MCSIETHILSYKPCFTLRVLAVGPFIIVHEHVHELHK